MSLDDFPLSEEEIKEIERVFAEECEILGGKKIKLCDCKGKKILVKAENG